MGKKVLLMGDGGDKLSTTLDKCVLSELITGMAEGHEEDIVEIRVPNVRSEVLNNVLEYLTYHADNRAPAIEKPLTRSLQEVLVEWDLKFVHRNYTHAYVFELMQAATYLTIRDMVELCSAVLAEMMKSKSVDEIRDMFGITNDFAPEEEELLRREFDL